MLRQAFASPRGKALFAVDPLVVRLAVPAIRVRGGLAPPSRPVITTMTETAPVKALRAMPGAPNKKDSAKNPPSP